MSSLRRAGLTPQCLGTHWLLSPHMVALLAGLHRRRDFRCRLAYFSSRDIFLFFVLHPKVLHYSPLL